MGFSVNRSAKGPRAGFSLIELLVVIAIIAILFGMYMSTIGKALRMAKKVVAEEALHQRQVGNAADGANSPNRKIVPANREECRAAFRHTVQTADGDILVTEVLYVVRDEAEFSAYWNTMINPDNPDEPEYAGNGSLIAVDEDGNKVNLLPMDKTGWSVLNANGPVFPVMWEFLSTRVADTTTSGNGINVAYSDAHIDYVPYKTAYPSTPKVAELSRRFYSGS